jgi:predicted phage terminase large subunit-like protein
MNAPESSLVLRALLRSDFRAFVEKCFNHLNPGQTYHDNWHVEVIAHHLKECLAGRVKRLVILLPPRNLKSTIVSIAWPAFVLGMNPTKKFICASYSSDLANKLSNDTRSIMTSDWYREIFPATVISPVKDTQSVFETTCHGGRFATSIGGPLTGFGGDIIVIDDPQKAMDMVHETSRHRARDWLFNTAISRFNSQKDGVLVLVMQRLHEDDLVGNIESNPDWTILKIPARAEEDLIYRFNSETELHFQAGAYLQEDRFGPDQYAAKRREMGSRDFSAQYQQNPLPLDGGLFNIDWFPGCDALPAVSELVMSVDVAATEGGGNYTAITIWGHLERRWYMIAARRFQFDLAKVRQTLEALDHQYQPDLVVIDSGGVGNGLVAELKNRGFRHIYPAGSRTSKLERAQDIAAMIEAGKVLLLDNAPGLADFRKEIISFPNGKFDDYVDSMTQVLRFTTRVITLARLHQRPVRRNIRSQNGSAAVAAISIFENGRVVRY